MNVIISGATGAIGTALIHECIAQGVQVLVLIRKDSKRLSNIPVDPLVKIKYCALDGLHELENDTGLTYDVFLHLAWGGTSGPGRNDMYMQNKNVEYALHAVDAAKRFGCHTFIGAGSQAEYGRCEELLTPMTPTFPDNGYGIAKLCAGQMTREHAHQLGMKHMWVRILSVFGPNDGKQSLIMSVLAALLKGESPRCTKGEQLWDYLYSQDAAAAFLHVARKGIDGKTYVLGGGKQDTLASYIIQMRDIVNKSITIDFGAIPYNDRQVMFLGADITSISEDTGWQPKTSFGDGIRRILEINREDLLNP